MAGKNIYNIASEENYDDGQTIFKEGSPGDWVYVILSGSVEISKNVGGKKFIIEILQPGEVFGELGFIGGVKRVAEAKAIGKTTVGVIDREFLEREYNQLSGQFRHILEVVTLRFKKMLDRTCESKNRCEPRAQKVLAVEFKDRQSFFRAYTGNVSTSGLFIRTEKPLDKGQGFILKLKLPDISEPLQIKSEVIWSRKEANEQGQPPGMGVKFTAISKKDNQLLKEFLTTIHPAT